MLVYRDNWVLNAFTEFACACVCADMHIWWEWGEGFNRKDLSAWRMATSQVLRILKMLWLLLHHLQILLMTRIIITLQRGVPPTGDSPSRTSPTWVLPMGYSSSRTAPAWVPSTGCSPSGAEGQTSMARITTAHQGNRRSWISLQTGLTRYRRGSLRHPISDATWPVWA